MPVLSEMPVLSATDVVSEKPLAMGEHYCDFAQVLPTVRSLQEQVDWAVVRQCETGHPYVEAFLFLLERLSGVEAR